MKTFFPMILMLFMAIDATAQEYAGRGGPNMLASVFRVQCRAAATPKGPTDIDLGTAFGHKSGNVLSASHVVDEAGCLKASGALKLVASDGRLSSVAVVLRDAIIDLVLLKPDADFVKNPLPVSSTNTMMIGGQVSFWGFPSGYSGKVALLGVGHLAGVQPDRNNPSTNRWVVNGAINKGNSGGPLLETSTPSIIGVVIQKFSPLSEEAVSALGAISAKGSPESQILAKAMLDIGNRSQLVIGQSVLTSDLKAFLHRAGVE